MCRAHASKRRREGSVYYVWSTVFAGASGWASVRKGGIAPTGIWVNNEKIGGTVRSVRLYRGTNTLLLRYEGSGRGFFVLAGTTGQSSPVARTPLASSWFNDPGVMHFDPLPDPAQSHRMVPLHGTSGPPLGPFFSEGYRSTLGRWNSVPVVPGTTDPQRFPSAECPGVASATCRCRLHALQPLRSGSNMDRGYYGGGAIPDPLLFECGSGVKSPGDLAQDRALSTYSGGMLYAAGDHVDGGAGRCTQGARWIWATLSPPPV